MAAAKRPGDRFAGRPIGQAEIAGHRWIADVADPAIEAGPQAPHRAGKGVSNSADHFSDGPQEVPATVISAWADTVERLPCDLCVGSDGVMRVWPLRGMPP